MFTSDSSLKPYFGLQISNKCVPEVTEQWEIVFICDSGLNTYYDYAIHLYFDSTNAKHKAKSREWCGQYIIYFNKTCSYNFYISLGLLFNDVVSVINLPINANDNKKRYCSYDWSLFDCLYGYINKLKRIPDTYVFLNGFIINMIV